MSRAYGTGPTQKEVRIECDFLYKRRDGGAICISDGSEDSLPEGLGTRPREIWIAVKHILDSDFDSVNDLTRGQRIEIFIPEWIATEKGLV